MSALHVEWSSGNYPEKLVVAMTREKYKDYLRIVVVAYNKELNFYERCGFKKSDDCSAMFITDQEKNLHFKEGVKKSPAKRRSYVATNFFAQGAKVSAQGFSYLASKA